MTTTNIGPIDAGETKPAFFLFSGELPTGATMTGASVSVALVTGTDENPAGILSGAVTIDNAAKHVSQKISAPGRTGNTYRLRCTANDNQGNVHVVAALLQVVSL
jgi:hypothetical protein